MTDGDNVQERPADIRQMQIPMIMEQTCKDWDKYSSEEVVDQIDSGLRRRLSGPEDRRFLI